MRKKYASDARSSDGEGTAAANAIEISSKIVEEVGFEKVRRQLAALHELRIVLLDGLCMGGVLACPRSAASDAAWLREIEEIGKTCPKIVELDLSRNLIEQWEDVAGICTALVFLRSLKVKYVGRWLLCCCRKCSSCAVAVAIDSENCACPSPEAIKRVPLSPA